MVSAIVPDGPAFVCANGSGASTGKLRKVQLHGILLWNASFVIIGLVALWATRLCAGLFVRCCFVSFCSLIVGGYDAFISRGGMFGAEPWHSYIYCAVLQVSCFLLQSATLMASVWALRLGFPHDERDHFWPGTRPRSARDRCRQFEIETVPKIEDK